VQGLGHQALSGSRAGPTEFNNVYKPRRDAAPGFGGGDEARHGVPRGLFLLGGGGDGDGAANAQLSQAPAEELELSRSAAVQVDFERAKA
jgi:hypothetical protein